MALDSRMQSWGVVAHCLQDATAIGKGVVLKCVDGDTHHSFDDQIFRTCSLFTPPLMAYTTCCVGILIHWPEIFMLVWNLQSKCIQLKLNLPAKVTLVIMLYALNFTKPFRHDKNANNHIAHYDYESNLAPWVKWYFEIFLPCRYIWALVVFSSRNNFTQNSKYRVFGVITAALTTLFYCQKYKYLVILWHTMLAAITMWAGLKNESVLP